LSLSSDVLLTAKLDAADISEYISELFDIGITESQKIRISGDSVIMSFPDQKQTGSFQNEPVIVGRDAEPVKESLHAVTGEQKIEIFPVVFGAVQKPLKD
jgi:hypothetical protein